MRPIVVCCMLLKHARNLLLLLAVVPLFVTTTTAEPLGMNPVMNGGFETWIRTNGEGGYADGALYWAHSAGSNARFFNTNIDGDADSEAYVRGDFSASSHNFWQSTLPPLQVFSPDFDAFAFTIERGTVAPSANIQIGFSTAPGYDANPFVGAFWDGAVMFRADDIAANTDASGRVTLDPVADGEIVCPAYEPCTRFKADFEAADDTNRSALLDQLRVIQMSFWNFNRQAGFIVIDDVEVIGADTPLV